MIMMNTRPIALIVLGAIIGYFLGSALMGALVGLAIIAAVHLFL
jgi:hypothetical protein